MTIRTGAEVARPLVLLTDLDDSCFQTERKCDEGLTLFPAAWDRSGAPRSFQHPAQVALLDLFHSASSVVPVTGRNRDALTRTIFRDAEFAITSFGAVIWTPHGPDLAWQEHTTSDDTVPELLGELQQALTATIQKLTFRLRTSLVRDADCVRYVSIKAEEAITPQWQQPLLAALSDHFALPPAWLWHSTDRSLAIGPASCDKAAAVRHFLTTYAPAHHCSIGLGDGLADASFLALCDFAMTPRGSVLHSRLTTPGSA